MVSKIREVINAKWEDYTPSIENEKIGTVLSDVPFGMSFQSNHRKVQYKKIANDDNLKWLSGWAKEMDRILEPNSNIAIFCSWHKLDKFMIELSNYFVFQDMLIWEKTNTGMGDLTGDYAPKYEIILLFSKGSNIELNEKNYDRILTTKRTNNDLHPTQKPVNLNIKILNIMAKTSGIVVDTFAGSFSTAKACDNLRLPFICIEVEKKYWAEAKKYLDNRQISLFGGF